MAYDYNNQQTNLPQYNQIGLSNYLPSLSDDPNSLYKTLLNYENPTTPKDSAPLSDDELARRKKTGSTAAAVGAVGSLVDVGLGLYEAVNAKQQINKLNSQPFPELSVDPALKNAQGRSEEMAKGGYTTAEKASFQADVNRGASTNYYNATQLSGGNLASAIGRAGNSEKLGAYEKFAASDAELHRQNIQQANQMAEELQQQNNLIQQGKIQRRTQLEEAYGGALQKGLSNIGTGLKQGISLATLV